MTRRCSHCSNNGHNSRTCIARPPAAASGVMLFGVRLTDGSFMKKSKSMGNLSHYHSSTSPAGNPGSPSSDHLRDGPNGGYLSDDPNHASCSLRFERKKGKPWNEEEHRLFLIGLQKLGKGDWRGISRTYVPSRTPTQVASHAQKHFIRQSNAARRKRRSSLFDMVPDMVTEEPQTLAKEQLSPPMEPTETDNTNSLPSTDLSLSRETAEPMEATSIEDPNVNHESMAMSMAGSWGAPLPAFLVPFPYPQFWPHYAFIQPEENRQIHHHNHQVLKPTAVVRKEPVNVDELVGMSRKLNLSETENGHIAPLKLSLGLLGTPSRQSAFHASVPDVSNGAKLNEGKNSAIQAL